MGHDGRATEDGDRDDGTTLDVGTEPSLLSRILVTWVELVLVGITGGALAATVGGPVGFIVSLATALLSVAVIFYNVNELVKEWLRAMGAE